MMGTRNPIRVPLTQARQSQTCPTPGTGERLGAHNGLLFSPTLMPLGMGWEKHQLTSISSFTSFTPSNPGARMGLGISFSFPAPKLYGSPELGVLIPSCIGDLAGGTKKKAKKAQR